MLKNRIIVNEYRIKADYFNRKYAKVASSCQDVVTMLKQIINVCKRMEKVTDNAFICVAVNTAIERQDGIMETLIFNATGLVFKKGRWVNFGRED